MSTSATAPARTGCSPSTYAPAGVPGPLGDHGDTLNARLAYERIAGTDGKGKRYDGVEQKPTNDGQIVASYAIESHFDIRRDYNPQTGEQLNVIVENSQDRPWYEREHMRVDWSKNLITDAYDYDTLSQIGVSAASNTSRSRTRCSIRPIPTRRTSSRPTGYFDVTNKVYATPQRVDLSASASGSTIPACLLTGDFAGGTDPGATAIRSSSRSASRTARSSTPTTSRSTTTASASRRSARFNFDYRRGYDAATA